MNDFKCQFPEGIVGQSVGTQKQHTCCIVIDNAARNTYVACMNAQELKKWLKAQGCQFESHKGGSGHLTVILGDKTSQLPMHGAAKELGTGLVNKIKKDLGLK